MRQSGRKTLRWLAAAFVVVSLSPAVVALTEVPAPYDETLGSEYFGATLRHEVRAENGFTRFGTIDAANDVAAAEQQTVLDVYVPGDNRGRVLGLTARAEAWLEERDGRLESSLLSPATGGAQVGSSTHDVVVEYLGQTVIVIASPDDVSLLAAHAELLTDEQIADGDMLARYVPVEQTIELSNGSTFTFTGLTAFLSYEEALQLGIFDVTVDGAVQAYLDGDIQAGATFVDDNNWPVEADSGQATDARAWINGDPVIRGYATIRTQVNAVTGGRLIDKDKKARVEAFNFAEKRPYLEGSKPERQVVLCDAAANSAFGADREDIWGTATLQVGALDGDPGNGAKQGRLLEEVDPVRAEMERRMYGLPNELIQEDDPGYEAFFLNAALTWDRTLRSLAIAAGYSSDVIKGKTYRELAEARVRRIKRWDPAVEMSLLPPRDAQQVTLLDIDCPQGKENPELIQHPATLIEEEAITAERVAEEGLQELDPDPLAPVEEAPLPSPLPPRY